MKLNKEYTKQIVLIFTGILLIFVGYLNYNLDIEETIQVSSNTNEINIGDVQLVNADTEKIYENAIVPNEDIIENTNIVENEMIENKIVNEDNKDNYFEETRIERDRMYSEMIETYQNLVNNQEIPADQKAISVQEISNITNIKNGIMISENLIKNKGFEDVVILVNNGMVSVVVKSYTLNKEEISKIQNIVERELKIDIKNINISNRY